MCGRGWQLTAQQRARLLLLLNERPMRSVDLTRRIYGEMAPRPYRAVMRALRDLGCTYGERACWSPPPRAD